ncbi:glycosyltransferase family 4 protein [Anaerosacchariphilus polymeriproducens]|uniref:Glycosyltransferase family 1 protein n=1 Tax=Anaerosacchariphilus polymeriproducens TaxID=1812858 RepID=A0A371AR92_9FIRM|nr:glycosyltransferase family 4 protein [Anaerosacchariphilus polymeriproducens]RDU22093.1 glycosyltransferase family 1 protein [Anaerosacchariphilus polymeriproducens]
MKKVLLVTTVSGFIPQFEMNNVKYLQSKGFEIHYATNYNMVSYGTDNSRLDNTGIIRHQIDFVRSPFSIKNIKVYKSLCNLICEEKFDLIHCHTPMGGAMARLAGRAARKSGTKIIYTAHGFHFFKGASFLNWMIYYPVERVLSYFTDVQITINQEDYQRAQNFHARRIEYVPGVGIDSTKLMKKEISDKNEFRKELGILKDSVCILSVGELIPRKNHATIIKALKGLNDKRITYLICGHGDLEEKLKHLVIELNLEKQVRFLGYRQDVAKIYEVCDIFAFPSFQEGLSVALMEAMAKGLSVVTSKVRGNQDLIENEKGGYTLAPTDVKGFRHAIEILVNDEKLRRKMGEYNQDQVVKYDIQNVKKRMKEIYNKELSLT